MSDILEPRVLVASNEQNDTRPAHRQAGGVKFEGEVESHVAPHRGRSARGTTKPRNPFAEVMSEYMDANGNILYND